MHILGAQLSFQLMDGLPTLCRKGILSTSFLEGILDAWRNQAPWSERVQHGAQKG